ncbi:MAG: isoprenylcysteine carboxylmethyltransferase family protein, partial [Actinomycetota bacterium]|nr:isoprenylcysteine carboxylmethyltransferase family protein [Actinomycetota bacterium]
EWATLPTLIMWPILMTIYYRLARREESEMREEFGVAYDEYAARTGMFLPTRVFRPAARRVVAPQGDHGA